MIFIKKKDLQILAEAILKEQEEWDYLPVDEVWGYFKDDLPDLESGIDQYHPSVVVASKVFSRMTKQSSDNINEDDIFDINNIPLQWLFFPGEINTGKITRPVWLIKFFSREYVKIFPAFEKVYNFIRKIEKGRAPHLGNNLRASRRKNLKSFIDNATNEHIGFLIYLLVERQTLMEANSFDDFHKVSHKIEKYLESYVLQKEKTAKVYLNTNRPGGGIEIDVVNPSNASLAPSVEDAYTINFDFRSKEIKIFFENIFPSEESEKPHKQNILKFKIEDFESLELFNDFFINEFQPYILKRFSS